jgi:hypothetical protein
MCDAEYPIAGLPCPDLICVNSLPDDAGYENNGELKKENIHAAQALIAGHAFAFPVPLRPYTTG